MTTLHIGNATDVMREHMADQSVHMCVTSPPYWALRSYLPDDDPAKSLELGSEAAPDCLGWATGDPCGECWVCQQVAVFREVRRVLRDDGTLWLNIGDSYNSGGNNTGTGTVSLGRAATRDGATSRGMVDALKPKDLIGAPWRLALALQADGWWLRSDIIWAKPNPMPGSQTDRPTSSHEHLFLLTKAARYFYDAEAIKETVAPATVTRARSVNSGGNRKDGGGGGDQRGLTPDQQDAYYGDVTESSTRTKRDVWTIATQAYKGSHYATYPVKLIEPCILAGTSAKGVCPECGAPWERVVEEVETGKTTKAPDGWDQSEGAHSSVHPNGRTSKSEMDGVAETRTETIRWDPTCECGRPDVQPATVFDPYMGAGTTAVAAIKHGRHAVGIDLDERNRELFERRIYDSAQPGLALG